MDYNSKRLIIIWLLLIFFHLVVSIIFSVAAPEYPNFGILILYGIIAAFSEIGLPLFVNPNSGWGWPEPNFLGWSMSVSVMVFFYLLVAYGISKFFAKKIK